MNRDPNSTEAVAARRSHFTLIELLLVLVILATLAALVVPRFAGRTEQAKITAAQTEIAGIEVALDAFEIDNGYYPQGGDGLDELFDDPGDAPSWRGPYLKKKITADPWQNPYLYAAPGEHNTSGYDLMSTGPDGRIGGGDDITNWSETQ